MDSSLSTFEQLLMALRDSHGHAIHDVRRQLTEKLARAEADRDMYHAECERLTVRLKAEREQHTMSAINADRQLQLAHDEARRYRLAHGKAVAENRDLRAQLGIAMDGDPDTSGPSGMSTVGSTSTRLPHQQSVSQRKHPQHAQHIADADADVFSAQDGSSSRIASSRFLQRLAECQAQGSSGTRGSTAGAGNDVIDLADDSHVYMLDRVGPALTASPIDRVSIVIDVDEGELDNGGDALRVQAHARMLDDELLGDVGNGYAPGNGIPVAADGGDETADEEEIGPSIVAGLCSQGCMRKEARPVDVDVDETRDDDGAVDSEHQDGAASAAPRKRAAHNMTEVAQPPSHKRQTPDRDRALSPNPDPDPDPDQTASLSAIIPPARQPSLFKTAQQAEPHRMATGTLLVAASSPVHSDVDLPSSQPSPVYKNMAKRVSGQPAASQQRHQQPHAEAAYHTHATDENRIPHNPPSQSHQHQQSAASFAKPPDRHYPGTTAATDRRASGSSTAAAAIAAPLTEKYPNKNQQQRIPFGNATNLPANASTRISTARPQVYEDVVRNKEARKQMNGETCSCCSGYYRVTEELQAITEMGGERQAMNKSAVEIRIQTASRHRFLAPTVRSPPGFWTLEFPEQRTGSSGGGGGGARRAVQGKGFAQQRSRRRHTIRGMQPGMASATPLGGSGGRHDTRGGTRSERGTPIPCSEPVTAGAVGAATAVPAVPAVPAAVQTRRSSIASCERLDGDTAIRAPAAGHDSGVE